MVSLFFVIATMIEFAIVLLIKRIFGVNDNQIPPSKRRECRRKNLRTGKLLCFYKRIPGGTKLDTNMMETNSIQELGEEETSTTQKRYYSVTDKIDFAAFFVFMVSYIIFNCVYVAHYM